MESDKLSEQIEALILEATEPKDKAFLLILNKIANNLDENTKLTRTLTDDLKSHTTAFEKHEKAEITNVNQVKGFIKAVLWGAGGIQAIGILLISLHFSNFSVVESDLTQAKTDIAAHKEHHKQEEYYRKPQK